MRIVTDTITIRTDEPISFTDITARASEALKKTSFKEGLVILSTQHTTTALCINERCNRLQEDMVEFLARLIPPAGDYRHNTKTANGRPNAHSHLMSLLLKTTEVIPFSGGALQLGNWQSIFFIELDGPREERTIGVTIIGGQ